MELQKKRINRKGEALEPCNYLIQLNRHNIGISSPSFAVAPMLKASNNVTIFSGIPTDNTLFSAHEVKIYSKLKTQIPKYRASNFDVEICSSPLLSIKSFTLSCWGEISSTYEFVNLNEKASSLLLLLI